jgi:hypothetical protein
VSVSAKLTEAEKGRGMDGAVINFYIYLRLSNTFTRLENHLGPVKMDQ